MKLVLWPVLLIVILTATALANPNITSITVSGNYNVSYTGSIQTDGTDPVYNITWYNTSNRVIVMMADFDINATNHALSNAMTVSGATQTTSNCHIGGCYSFDGTNDYINTGINTELNHTGSLTATMWIYTRKTNGIIISKDNNAGILHVMHAANGTLRAKVQEGGVTFLYNSLTNVSLLNWHFVAYLKNTTNDRQTFFIDGVFDSAGWAAYTEASTTDSSLPIWLGRDPGNNGAFYNGSIDEVRLFNYTLTQQELLSLYNDIDFRLDSNITTVGQTWTFSSVANDATGYSTKNSTSFTIAAGCFPDWQTNYLPCNTNNSIILYYTDSNNCGEAPPADNGTVSSSCNYCSYNLSQTSWSTWTTPTHSCGTRSAVINDTAYSTCCNVTNLTTDCYQQDQAGSNALTYNLTQSTACTQIYETSDSILIVASIFLAFMFVYFVLYKHHRLIGSTAFIVLSLGLSYFSTILTPIAMILFMVSLILTTVNLFKVKL